MTTGKTIALTQETQSQSLDQEDPLEEGMAIHSNILAWRIPWREEPGGLNSKGLQRVGHRKAVRDRLALQGVVFCVCVCVF